MVGGNKPHSLVQGASWWGADYSQTQLSPPNPQKSKLLDQAHALPLDLFPLSVGVGYLINQARMFCLSHAPGLACNRKLIPEKGDLLSYLISFPVSRSQHGGTLQSLALSPGGPGPCHNSICSSSGHHFLMVCCIRSISGSTLHEK
jgi:hypothetical protein